MNSETTFNAGDIVFVRDVEGPQTHKIIEVNTTERVDSRNKKTKETIYTTIVLDRLGMLMNGTDYQEHHKYRASEGRLFKTEKEVLLSEIEEQKSKIATIEEKIKEIEDRIKKIDKEKNSKKSC